MTVSAVITADIVNSTTLNRSREKKLIERLRDTLEDFKFEFYRGDSFQVYCKDPGNALRVILKIRSVARSVSKAHDIRASLGIGKIITPVRSLKTAKGEAFLLSGRAFDDLSGENRLVMRSADQKLNSSLRMMGHFMDHIFNSVTPKQAEVINEFLEEETQAAAAKKLKKSQVTVHKLLRSAGWNDMEKILIEYEFIIFEYFKS